MTKEDVRALLNTNKNFYIAVNKTTEYVLQPEIRDKIATYIAKEIVKIRNFTSNHMFAYFVSAMKPVVQNTNLCRDNYGEQMFLKNVWMKSDLQSVIVKYIKNPPKQEEPKKDLSIQEKRVLQAQIMRDAKAKKAREKKLREQQEKQKSNPAAPSVLSTKQPEKNSNLSVEQLKQIEFLKKLNT